MIQIVAVASAFSLTRNCRATGSEFPYRNRLSDFPCPRRQTRQAVLVNPAYCRQIGLSILYLGRHQQSGNEARPCHAELGKMVTSKNQEDGLSYDSGKTFPVRKSGCTFENASARSLVPAFFPRANANGNRGRLSKKAVRTPLNTSRTLLSRTPESRSVSNRKSGCVNCRIASVSQLGVAMRPQSKEHSTSGFFLPLGTFRLRTSTIYL